MRGMPSTMFALGLVLSASIAVGVLARPEAVPRGLAPPARSDAAKKDVALPSGEPTAEDTSDDNGDDPPPQQKGYALTRQDLNLALSRVHARAMACRSEGPPPVVPLHIVISPSGAVTSVGLPAELRGTRAGECISHAMHAMSFPAWRQPEKAANVEWSYPLRFELGP